MNNRGEKLSRARILLRELSSLNDRSLEEMNQSQLQSLATEYNALSSDPEIKDQFRRMEQSISISPTVISVLKQAKENPGAAASLTSANSNSANDQAEQDFQVQQLRAEYDSMSDYDKKNMSIEDFRKYYKVDSRVIIDNPNRFQEEARRNPSMVYETTYHNGTQMKVYEVYPVAANKLKEDALNLAEEDKQCTSDAEQIVRDTYVYLIRTGHTPEEAKEKLKNQYGNHPFYQGFLSRMTSATFQSLTEHANQEGALSNEEAKQQLGRLLANRNSNEERRRHIIERCGQLNKLADNLSAGAQTVKEAGQNLGDQEVINAGQVAEDIGAGVKRILSGIGIYNRGQDIKISSDAVEKRLNADPNTIAPNKFSSFISKNFTFSPKSENDVNFILDNVNMHSVKHVYDSFNDERMAALDQRRIQLFNEAITDISLDFTGTSVPVEDLAQHVATLKASIVEIKNSPTLSADPEIMAKVQELDEQLDTAILESLPENKREEYSSRLQEALPQQTAYVRSEIDKEKNQFNNDLMLEIQNIVKRRKMESNNWQEEALEIVSQNAIQNALIDSENLINDSINQTLSEINNEITNPHIDSFINDEVDIPDLSEGLAEDPQDFIGANMFGDPFAGSLDEETDLGNTTEFLNGIEEETVASDDTSIQEEEVAVEEDANALPEETRPNAENQDPTNVDINTDTNSEEELVVDSQNFGDPFAVNPFSDGYIEENESETTDELQNEEEVAVEESANALPEETRPDTENQEPTNATDQNENRGVSRVLASAGQSVPRDIHINSYQDQYNR